MSFELYEAFGTLISCLGFLGGVSVIMILR